MIKLMKLFSMSVILASGLLISSCGTPTTLTFKNLSEVISPSVLNWTIEDCNQIINFYTRRNYLDTLGFIKNDPEFDDQVFVSALPMLPKVIKAIAKKEAILKRLKTNEFYDLLDYYFYKYTDYTYNKQFDRIVYSNPRPDSAIGLTFELFFENQTFPYRPIEIRDGYEYFFLENGQNEFVRIVEISGRFSEADIYLTDFLNVTVTFSAHADNGKLLFTGSNFQTGFKLVFNALQKDPIVLTWDF